MRAVGLAFGSGLILGAVVLGVTLSDSPISVARVNGAKHMALGSLSQRTAACQEEEVLPGGTSAVRLSVFAYTGPRVTVAMLSQGHIIARGEHASGWTGGSVTVPVNRLATTRDGVTLCFALFLNGDETVDLTGESTDGAHAAQARAGPLRGRVRAEDLRPGRSSWWSLMLPVARRMGLGHAAGGTWLALLVVGLMLAVVAFSARVVFRELA